MELTQLRYVAELSGCLNYTKAANHLFISQPALSQQIAKLEHEFGFSIFERNTKNVSLTPEGEIILPKLKKVLADLDELSRSVANINASASGDVRLGLNLIDRSAIPKAISSFVKTFPAVRVQIREGWTEILIGLLQNGELDAALIAHPVGDGLERNYEIPSISFTTLSSDYLVLAVGIEHKFASLNRITLDEILDEMIVFPSEHSNVSRQVMTRFKKLGLVPKHVFFLDSSPSLIDFIFSGAGISFISSQHAQKYAGRQTLVPIPVYPLLERRSAIITPVEAKISPAARLLREYLVSKLSTVSE